MPETDARDGVRIHYEMNGEGAPLLLTHGYASTSRMWRAQLASLGEDRHVIAWDMRGHGRSASPADPAAYSLEACVDDMVAVLDAAKAPKAVVGGLSLGGYVSLAFWLAHPERVRALVLVDTGPGFKQDAAREGWNRGVAKVVKRLDDQGLAYLDRLGDEVSAAEHASAEGLIFAARGILTQHDARVIESLPDIDVPTLIVVGENDRPFHAATDYMARKITGARKVVIPDAGHAVNLHQPARFEAELALFLEEIEG
jgi:pimeloyl-ACP methyl ester carboxylesterase